MAGLAAIMTRKNRDKRNPLQSELSFAEVVGGKEPQLLKKPTSDAMQKLLIGKAEVMRQKSKAAEEALNRESHDEHGEFKINNAPTNLSLYIGMIIICTGTVIIFVGLGDKGFKTVEMKLVGPVLCLIGLACIFLKILQCTFPELFEQGCSIFRQANKLADSDQPNLTEKEAQNGHFGNNSMKTSPQALSRVTLHSSKKETRPCSTIPNYIEDTSDEDDFNPNKDRPQSNRYSSLDAEKPQQLRNVDAPAPGSQLLEVPQQPLTRYFRKNEVVLNPKTLML